MQKCFPSIFPWLLKWVYSAQIVILVDPFSIHSRAIEFICMSVYNGWKGRNTHKVTLATLLAGSAFTGMWSREGNILQIFKPWVVRWVIKLAAIPKTIQYFWMYYKKIAISLFLSLMQHFIFPSAWDDDLNLVSCLSFRELQKRKKGLKILIDKKAIHSAIWFRIQAGNLEVRTAHGMVLCRHGKVSG